MLNCCMIDVYSSGCSCLLSCAQFCRTKFAQFEHVAPNTSQFYLKIFSMSFSVHSKRRMAWSRGWMPICVNISSISAWISTEYCQEEKACRLLRRCGRVSKASLMRFLLILDAAFLTLLIFSGFGSLITEL